MTIMAAKLSLAQPLTVQFLVTNPPLCHGLPKTRTLTFVPSSSQILLASPLAVP
jgi:hypothetical protein